MHVLAHEFIETIYSLSVRVKFDGIVYLLFTKYSLLKSYFIRYFHRNLETFSTNVL